MIASGFSFFPGTGLRVSRGKSGVRFRLLFAVSLLLIRIICLSAASAEPVTLYTVSSFAGGDASAAVYANLLRSFEKEESCVIIDHSSASSESWKKSVLNDFAAGNEPDVLFFFAHSADSQTILSRVVPIEEINRVFPFAEIPVSDALREPDGQVYAVPVRPFWEGILCNTALFDQYDLSLPDTWEHFVEAIRVFRRNGVIPIALSVMDAPHYVAEMVLLACATSQEQQARPASFEDIPASWFEGMSLLRELYEMGTFPEQTTLLDEASASALFRSGKAAMQVDGSWFALGLTEEEMAHTAVLPVPRIHENPEDPVAYIGGVSMGFYLTRRAYGMPEIRDKAVRLLAYLTREESRTQLAGGTLTGLTAATAAALIAPENLMLSPIQDDMSAAAREVWLLECIPAVAEGTMTPEECWRRVIELKPFQQEANSDV